MSNLLAYEGNSLLHESLVRKILNLSNNLKVKTLKEKRSIFAISCFEDSPLKGDRIFENENWIVLFAGDLIGFDSIPHPKIIEALENESYLKFKELNGVFSISAFNKKNKTHYIVSDLRSQYPIFYHLSNNIVLVSSELPAFCKIIETEFNVEWLYEYLFFNYPIDSKTFLKNVWRMPPASVLIYNLKTGKQITVTYASPFKAKYPLLKKKEALDLAKEVLGRRIPLNFDGANNIACGFTGGWDGRTNVALAPDYNKITTYTYGIPNCKDLYAANIASGLANIKHIEIPFDNALLNSLSNYFFETVYLSSGLQGILRSSLMYVYENLRNGNPPFTLTISGVSHDTLFRGHLGIPIGVSRDMVNVVKFGRDRLNLNPWKEILNKNFEAFSDKINSQIAYLENKFGDFKSTEHHFLYQIYISVMQYFSGELKLASNFTTVRFPAWDYEIINLAFSIEHSCLTFSELTGHKRESRNEMVLQSYILSQLSPTFAKIPIRNTKPTIVLKGEVIFQIYKAYIIILKRLVNKYQKIKFSRLEDWDNWLNVRHKQLIDNILLSNDSLISNYLNISFMKGPGVQRDILLLGKLITLEIILKLIKNKWERFW